MKSRVKKSAVITALLFILSALFIFLIKNVDVAAVGEYERVVGLASLNRFFYNFFEFNEFWYKLTNYPGMLIDALVAFIFSFIGLKQWLQRKSLSKVDKNLFVLGGIYVLSLVVYFLFEKLAINYRPIVLPNEKFFEPSFPSSHTMWAVVVMGTAIMECKRLIKNLKMRTIVNFSLCAIIFITVIGRLISGVHWFTDILGGILIGSTLLALYSLAVNMVSKKRIK